MSGVLVSAGLWLLALTIGLAVCPVGTLFYQGKRRPAKSAQYVALGSSFAAGLGLGPRAPGSPCACMKSTNGYPQQLARLAGLTLSDMTCSGATSEHVWRGRQFFQGPQLDALDAKTELVTLTAGGNDVRYVGDLVMLSNRSRKTLMGVVLRLFWKGPKPIERRNFAQLSEELRSILYGISERAPRARVIVVTYPAILPPHGTCMGLKIAAAEAAQMREVADKLADVTRATALEAGATIVDMATLSLGHDACASTPWVNGPSPKDGAPYHPNLIGAEATARAILQVIKSSVEPV